MNDKKKVVFVTGTRADYGKMKPLIKKLDLDERFDAFVFVCGMHISKVFGSTYEEVLKDGYENIHVAYGLLQSTDAGANLGNTIAYFSGFVNSVEPDMIIVHGDRMDALAGAVVGALHNILVGHIEGGELSGTIDESIRHAISKFAHVHFVCTEEAKIRLVQLGEEENRIHVIGSPDIDIMMSKNLPSLKKAKERYEINFNDYGILMYHPVTTEYDQLSTNIREVVSSVLESNKDYIVIYPNNDLGSEIIIHEYERLCDSNRFRIFPSLRFEYFLTFLKNAKFVLGNSSAGIREAGIYGIPAIDVGTRQSGRYRMDDIKHIVHINENKDDILKSLMNINAYAVKSQIFGDGNSTEQFYEIVSGSDFWEIDLQKHFVDFQM